jgi:AraC-like DNA-binding protein
MLMALRHLILAHAGASRPTQAEAMAGAARRMEAYRELIEADLAGRFDLARFAAAGSVTRFQVIRDFRRVTGFTPGAFVRDRRLRSAARLIQAGERLADAAISAGFADQSHLSRAFKLAHGVTPGSMRQAFVD